MTSWRRERKERVLQQDSCNNKHLDRKEGEGEEEEEEEGGKEEGGNQTWTDTAGMLLRRFKEEMTVKLSQELF